MSGTVYKPTMTSSSAPGMITQQNDVTVVHLPLNTIAQTTLFLSSTGGETVSEPQTKGIPFEENALRHPLLTTDPTADVARKSITQAPKTRTQSRWPTTVLASAAMLFSLPSCEESYDWFMEGVVRGDPIQGVILAAVTAILGSIAYGIVSDHFIRKRTTPDRLRLLIEQGHWDRVDKMLLFVHRHGTTDSFRAEFQSTVLENENDGMPNHILERVATMKGQIEPSNMAFESLIRRQAWAEVRNTLNYSDAHYDAKVSAALQKVIAAEAAAESSKVPNSILELAATIKGFIKPMVKVFEVLIGREAWDEVKNFLNYADQHFNDEARSALKKALAGEMANVKAEVPDDILELASQADDAPSVKGILTVLIKKKDWDRVRATILVLNNNSDIADRAMIQSTVIEHSSEEVPSDILELAATMVGEVGTTERAFEALIKRRAWDEVRNVLKHSTFNDNVRKVLKEVVERHASSSTSAVPNDIIELAVTVPGGLGPTKEVFKILIKREAWDEVKRILSDPRDHYEEVPYSIRNPIYFETDIKIPNDVLVLAAKMGGDIKRTVWMFERLVQRDARVAMSEVLEYARQHFNAEANAALLRTLNEYRASSNQRYSSAGEENRRAWGGRESSERVGGGQIQVNYFETLGLEPRMDVSDAELQKAKKRMIRMYHPDHFTNGGPKIRQVADEETKRIIEAYEVLKNPASRRRHLEEVRRKKS